MFDVNVKLINELKNFIYSVASNEVLLDKFRHMEGDFSRNRKLPFPALVVLITKLCKKTLIRRKLWFGNRLPSDLLPSGFNRKILVWTFNKYWFCLEIKTDKLRMVNYFFCPAGADIGGRLRVGLKELRRRSF